MAPTSMKQELPKSWQAARARLAHEIVSCLRHGNSSAVNLSIPKHTATAAILRQFAYDEQFASRSIPVVFSDGSRPTPFPVGVLLDAEPHKSPVPEILLGLNSFRHADMDFLADLYLLTNVEIDRGADMAEEEQTAFDAAVRTLRDPAIRDGAIIRVLHTGLEPIVVGFYRGVIESLRWRQRNGLARSLTIIPCLFNQSPGLSPFAPNSPGANLDSYIECKAWL